MIPVPLIMGALGRVPWRLVGVVGMVAAVALAGWRVNTWHESHVRLKGVQAQLEAERACADGSECRARETRLQEAVGHETVRIVTGYEAELASLRDRKPRVVRLCPEAGAGGVRGPGSTAAPDGAGPAAGFVSGPAGGDIGPELYRLARDADEVTARLRALQGWNEALSSR